MTDIASVVPDGHIRFRILTADEGGKQGNGFSGKGSFFNCPLLAPDGSYWDCRAVLRPPKFGSWREVRICVFMA